MVLFAAVPHRCSIYFALQDGSLFLSMVTNQMRAFECYFPVVLNDTQGGYKSDAEPQLNSTSVKRQSLQIESPLLHLSVSFISTRRLKPYQ